MFGSSAPGQYGVSGEACPSLLLVGGRAGLWGEAWAGKNDGACHYLGWLRQRHRRLGERLRSDDITETGLLIHFTGQGTICKSSFKRTEEKKQHLIEAAYCIWQGFVPCFIQIWFIYFKKIHIIKEESQFFPTMTDVSLYLRIYFSCFLLRDDTFTTVSFRRLCRQRLT